MVDHDAAKRVESILRNLEGETSRLVDVNPLPMLSALQDQIDSGALGVVSDDVALLIHEARRRTVDLSALLDSVRDAATSLGWGEK